MAKFADISAQRSKSRKVARPYFKLDIFLLVAKNRSSINPKFEPQSVTEIWVTQKEIYLSDIEKIGELGRWWQVGAAVVVKRNEQAEKTKKELINLFCTIFPVKM